MSAGKKILIMSDWYEPGYKAGGPIRSCVNFVSHMRSDYILYIFTSDRDLGNADPYENINTNGWSSADGKVYFYYASPDRLNWQNIRRQVDAVRPDFIYLNSMFSLNFTIYPMLISRLYKSGVRVVLSPRGMLRESAIRYKTAKKILFLKAIRLLGLHRSLRFHATDSTEVNDIRRYFGTVSHVAMIPNFPGAVREDQPFPPKEQGQLSMIFVGRIHPIKNLDYLLTILKEVLFSRVLLTIVGSLEDLPYWEKCRGIIAGLPRNITVEYAGEIANHELPAITARHHIFALPTQGENFGHAIFEALAMGKPVLISDQTPWRNLQAEKAGWDLPLDRPGEFLSSIGQAADFGQEEYNAWSLSTFKYIQDYIERLTLKEDYLKLFSKVPG